MARRVSRLRYVPDPERDKKHFETRLAIVARGMAIVAPRLREADVLAKADGKFREGVQRADVEAKLGEPIFVASDQFRLRKRHGDLYDWILGQAAAYHKADAALHDAGINGHTELQKMASFERERADELREAVDFRGALQFRRRTMNKLTMELVAVIRHTTLLSNTFAAQRVLPDILDVASQHFDIPTSKADPDDAPSPWIRYKDIAAKAKKEGHSTEDVLFQLRVELFAGDTRFPAALWAPHRSRRSAREQ